MLGYPRRHGGIGRRSTRNYKKAKRYIDAHERLVYCTPVSVSVSLGNKKTKTKSVNAKTQWAEDEKEMHKAKERERLQPGRPPSQQGGKAKKKQKEAPKLAAKPYQPPCTRGPSWQIKKKIREVGTPMCAKLFFLLSVPTLLQLPALFFIGPQPATKPNSSHCHHDKIPSSV